MKTTKRICLWSSPRNLSTAFMYSWAQRSDTTVVDEPLYGYFLNHTGAERPGRDEVIKSMDTNGKRVIAAMLHSDYNTPVVFFKHLTNQAVDLDWSFMQQMVNLFFIRDPKQIISSFAQVIQNPAMIDIAMKMQYNCFEFALQNKFNTIVLDSFQLLKNPKAVLQKLCDRIEIDFDENMLHWQPGPKPYDGVWAPYWYANVHQSSGFDVQPTSERPLPAHLISLYEEAKPFYEKMFQYSIKA
ncbi:MAG: sulfotransferase family protein [Bacteroidia bacterium]